MSEIAELFNELLFGSGSWFGLILILAIIILVTSKERLAGLIFFPVIILLSIKYLQQMTETGNLAWQIIILVFASVYVLLKATGKIGS